MTKRWLRETHQNRNGYAFADIQFSPIRCQLGSAACETGCNDLWNMAPFNTMFKKTLIAISVCILLVVAGSALWVQQWTKGRLSVPTALATAALQSDESVQVSLGDWLVFSPKSRPVKLGLVFYPGAHCDVRGYAPALRAIAEQGYLVVAASMPLYLAFLAPERASDVVAAYADVDQWVIAGHSLGGAMAARYVYRHSDVMGGLIIWDSYPADSMLQYEEPVWLIHRAGADGKPPRDYAEGLKRFPAHTQYVPIHGGNHMNFGDFILGPAQEVLDASISSVDQQDRTAEATLAALDQMYQARQSMYRGRR